MCVRWKNSSMSGQANRTVREGREKVVSSSSIICPLGL